VFRGALGHLLNPWAHWDGVWYIKIATGGYADSDGSTAFFPLFPMLLRYVGLVFRGNLVITGVVISLVCYAGCVWLLYRLVRSDFDDEVASRAVVYLAIGPLSFFLQAVYTESLFLVLTLACFVFAREGHWRLAGIMGLLATLTRSTGVLLLVPMAYYYYERRGWKLRRS
jgi:Gpi18-like mannosyltransferase